MAKKPTAQARSLIGTESLHLLAHIAHGLAPEVRASSGLATALYAFYQARLEDAEAQTERLGKCGGVDDAASAAYARQTYQTQELRGAVAIMETLDKTLKTATRRAGRMEELTRRCKGGVR